MSYMEDEAPAVQPLGQGKSAGYHRKTRKKISVLRRRVPIPRKHGVFVEAAEVVGGSPSKASRRRDVAVSREMGAALSRRKKTPRENV